MLTTIKDDDRDSEMRSMKIAVCVEYFPPKLGSDRRIFEIMKRMSCRHEIHFIIFPPFRKMLKHSLHTDLPKKASTFSIKGIHGDFISMPSEIAQMWRRSLVIAYCLTSAWTFLKSVRIMRKINPDVVALNYPSPYTGLLGFLIGRLWNKPVVLDFNDLIAQYTTNFLNLKADSFKARMLLFVQHYLVRNSRRVVAPTDFIKRYSASLGIPESKITTISNGVDVAEFNPSRFDSAKLRLKLGHNDEKLCVYCGRIDGWAGTDIISKLSDICRIRKLNVKFVLAGSGMETTFNKENVLLLGEVPYEEIPHLLATADVILVPFPNNYVSHAASPLKLFEGMAMQKPVIASKVSGIEEVVSEGENCFLAVSDNVDEWFKKLEIVLKDGKLAAKVGENARRAVQEKFDWTLLAIQFEEVLGMVVFEHENSRFK